MSNCQEQLDRRRLATASLCQRRNNLRLFTWPPADPALTGISLISIFPVAQALGPAVTHSPTFQPQSASRLGPPSPPGGLPATPGTVRSVVPSRGPSTCRHTGRQPVPAPGSKTYIHLQEDILRSGVGKKLFCL